MKKTFILLGVLIIFLGVIFAHNYSSFSNEATDQDNFLELLQKGDIIFQTSGSGQSMAIQLATHSKYSHCGILCMNNGNLFVYEAVQPVKMTPIKTWIARGDDNHFVVKRLKNASSVLTPDVFAKMKAVGEQFKGKQYDLTFEWNDDKLYCSELVWKIYKRGAGIELGELMKLEDFDLSSPIVKNKIKERYGNNIPFEEKVISPESIFASPLLEIVVEQ